MDEGLIQEMLLQWEEEAKRGRATSAEELCREDPELIEIVKARIQALIDMAWLDQFAISWNPVYAKRFNLHIYPRPYTQMLCEFRQMRKTIRTRRILGMPSISWGPRCDRAYSQLFSKNSFYRSAANNRTPFPGNLPQTHDQWCAFDWAIHSLPGPERDVFDLIWYLRATRELTADVLEISDGEMERRWLSVRLLSHKYLRKAPLTTRESSHG